MNDKSYSFSSHKQSKGRRQGIILETANQWKDTVNVTTRSFSSSFLQAALSRSSRPQPNAISEDWVYITTVTRPRSLV